MEYQSFQDKVNAEPENLLLITRTRTELNGRRLTAALPVIPPPNGERFEGGYHIERNPINGALTIVEPGKSSKELKLTL